jgi:hypothetical protein
LSEAEASPSQALISGVYILKGSYTTLFYNPVLTPFLFVISGTILLKALIHYNLSYKKSEQIFQIPLVYNFSLKQ